MVTIDTSSQQHRLTVLNADDNFRFACRKGLDCFTRCCRNINIFLTPYDIIRMKNALQMSSEDFLPAYTATLIGETGLPLVCLKMQEDEEKSCPFVTPEGCTIYEDRPWSCRIYPLKPESSKITDKSGKEYYSVMDVPFCIGLSQNKTMTVEKWKEAQGIPIYLEMEAYFKRITMDEMVSNRKIENRQIQEMYYMASYDPDRFRRFVLDSKFLTLFDVDLETVKKIKHDDIALYKFSMKWLEYGLLGQHVLKVKPEVMAEKKRNLGQNDK